MVHYLPDPLSLLEQEGLACETSSEWSVLMLVILPYIGCRACRVCALESSSYYSCLSVCLSVTGPEVSGNGLDLDTQDAISLAVELQKLETGSLCNLPSQVLRERQRANQQVFWAVDQLANVLKQDVVNAHAQAPQFWNAAPCVCCLHNQCPLATLCYTMTSTCLQDLPFHIALLIIDVRIACIQAVM